MRLSHKQLAAIAMKRLGIYNYSWQARKAKQNRIKRISTEPGSGGLTLSQHNTLVAKKQIRDYDEERQRYAKDVAALGLHNMAVLYPDSLIDYFHESARRNHKFGDEYFPSIEKYNKDNRDPFTHFSVAWELGRLCYNSNRDVTLHEKINFMNFLKAAAKHLNISTGDLLRSMEIDYQEDEKDEDGCGMFPEDFSDCLSKVFTKKQLKELGYHGPVTSSHR
jgi:hypothetical protein